MLLFQNIRCRTYIRFIVLAQEGAGWSLRGDFREFTETRPKRLLVDIEVPSVSIVDILKISAESLVVPIEIPAKFLVVALEDSKFRDVVR